VTRRRRRPVTGFQPEEGDRLAAVGRRLHRQRDAAWVALLAVGDHLRIVAVGPAAFDQDHDMRAGSYAEDREITGRGFALRDVAQVRQHGAGVSLAVVSETIRVRGAGPFRHEGGEAGAVGGEWQG
jgi:hypothetical protein